MEFLETSAPTSMPDTSAPYFLQSCLHNIDQLMPLKQEHCEEGVTAVKICYGRYTLSLELVRLYACSLIGVHVQLSSSYLSLFSEIFQSVLFTV